MKLSKAESNLKGSVSVCADHNKLGREKAISCKELHLEEINTNYSKTMSKRSGIIPAEKASELLTHLFAVYCNVVSFQKR